MVIHAKMLRVRRWPVAAALAVGAASLLWAATAAPSRAAVVHTVSPGESLWSIAGIDGLSPSALAAANGLPADAQLLVGQNLTIPAPVGAATSVGGEPDGDSDDQPPYPTGGSVSPALVGQIASEHGVSPGLAEAVASEESGFNNNAVSPANAHGVMQIEPSTWRFVQSTLTPLTLDPYSPSDNVHAGVLLLDDLLRATGGDPRRALAGYYQGLGSVQHHGLRSDTQQYVDTVLALAHRYGG